MVDALCKVTCHLKVLELIFSYRYKVSLMLEDIGCHEHWVCEETSIHVVWLLTSLVLE